MIRDANVNDEDYCNKIIADIFVKEFINENRDSDFCFYCRPDVLERQKAAPDFLYTDASKNKNLFMEVKRVVDSSCSLNRSIMGGLNDLISKIGLTVNGTYWLLIKSEVYPNYKKRNLRKEFLASIIPQLQSAVKALSVGQHADIHEAISLWKFKDEGNNISVFASDLYSDPLGNERDIVEMLTKVAEQFKQYKTQNSSTILLILKSEGIREWYKTTLVIRDLLDDMIIGRQFQHDVINEVYEIIFDDTWEGGIIVNLSYPTSRSDELISDKGTIFDSKKIYFKWRNEYFRL